MVILKIRTSYIISLIIIVIGVLAGGFLLVFGVANLINPDVPDTYLLRNSKICLAAGGAGILLLLLARAVFREISHKNK